MRTTNFVATSLVAARSIAVTLVIALAGCAAVHPRDGFQAVEQDLSTRLPQKVSWSTGASQDRQLADAVAALLGKPLTADAAVQVALLNNRRLQATYETLGIAQADLVQAGLLKNPIFSGDVKFAEGGGTKVELSLVADFLDLLYIPLRKSLAQTSLQAAQVRVTGAVLDTAAAARQAFVRLQAAEQVLDLRRSVLQAVSASYELSKRIRDAGNNTALDVAREQAFYEEAKLSLASAELEAAELREQLVAVMGLWDANAMFTLEPRLADVPTSDNVPADIERRALAGSTELAESRLAIALAAKQPGATKPLGLLSELELGVAFERDADGAREVGPAFAVPLPLFSQGQPAVAKADAILRQAKQEHYALAVEVRSAARTASARLISARERAEYFRKVVLPLRHTIVEETQKQYNGMLVGAFELLSARQAEIEAGRGYVESVRDYWLAKAGCDQILAGRLPRSAAVSNNSNNMSAQSQRKEH